MKILTLAKETIASLSLKSGMRAGLNSLDPHACGNTRNEGVFGCILDPTGGPVGGTDGSPGTVLIPKGPPNNATKL